MQRELLLTLNEIYGSQQVLESIIRRLVNGMVDRVDTPSESEDKHNSGDSAYDRMSACKKMEIELMNQRIKKGEIGDSFKYKGDFASKMNQCFRGKNKIYKPICISKNISSDSAGIPPVRNYETNMDTCSKSKHSTNPPEVYDLCDLESLIGHYHRNTLATGDDTPDIQATDVKSSNVSTQTKELPAKYKHTYKYVTEPIGGYNDQKSQTNLRTVDTKNEAKQNINNTQSTVDSALPNTLNNTNNKPLINDSPLNNHFNTPNDIDAYIKSLGYVKVDNK